MRRLIILSITLVSLALVVAWFPPSSTHAQDPCSGLVPSRLSVGMTARVILDGDGIGTIFRTGPGKEQSGSSVIRALPEGEIVELVRGPVCLDGLVSWQVKLLNGEEGWVPEGDAIRYLLEPYEIGHHIFRTDETDPAIINRWYVSYSGIVTPKEPFILSLPTPALARDLWQAPDIDAANQALTDRRANCPQVLQGTVWETITNAGDITIPAGTFDIFPAPNGSKALIINHRVLQIPTCGGSPGVYYGISTVFTLFDNGTVVPLFPYGQHNGARSTTACHSADVPELAWTTYLDEVVWSPDSDSVAITARYLQYVDPIRRCAYYYIYLADALNGRVDPIAEGRRVGWGGGGTKLFYVTLELDNGYNVLGETVWQLSEGQTTSLNISEDVQFVPRSFNSTGASLPWTENGRFALVCSTYSGCPAIRSFELSLTNPTFSEAIPVPEALLPYQIANVYYVAGDTRVLWLTTDGTLYLEAILGVGVGLSQQINFSEPFAAESKVTEVIPMTTGIMVILRFENGEYGLFNTLDRSISPLILSTENVAP